MSSAVNKAACNVIAYYVRLEEREREKVKERHTERQSKTVSARETSKSEIRERDAHSLSLETSESECAGAL
jgi:hypothetical protein